MVPCASHLPCAALKGHVDIVELLVEHGANLNAAAVLGPTAQLGKVCSVI